MTSPDKSQWWHLYHAKRDSQPAWRRAVYAQPMDWSSTGLPLFGDPVDAGRPLDLPSGTPTAINGGRQRLNLREPSVLSQLDYFGHHQLFAQNERGIALGAMVQDPVNLYRCGEKIILRDTVYADAEIVVEFSFVDGYLPTDEILCRMRTATVRSPTVSLWTKHWRSA